VLEETTMTDSDRTGSRREDLLAGAEEDAAREAGAAATAKPKVVTPKARTSSRRSAGVKASKPADAATPAPSPSGARRRGTSSTSSTSGVSRTSRSSSEPAAPKAATADVPTDDRASAARPVSGEIVTIRGGAETVTATNVDLRQGGIGRARATDIAVSQGGVGLARADRVSVELGGIGAALGGEVSITQGGAGSILAREARVEQSVVRTLVANQVHVERATGVVFLIARRVDGNVRAILDWRGALAFGAAFGLVTGLLRRTRRR
jgi:hypothetical protein